MAMEAACMRGGGRREAGWGVRARAERTASMPPMVVTLDVSKLSGWLNNPAPCRAERRAYGAGWVDGRVVGGASSVQG